MRLLNNKTTAILGAGPVGLTMATLLQQAGATVTVYERDKDPQARVWGGTLDLHESSGQKAMKKAGLLERYFGMAIPMGRIIADEQGKVLFSKEPAADNPEINRNELRQLLLQSLTGGTVAWDRKCTGLEEQDGRWLLHFENGMTATADVVIAADGGMSKARIHVTDAEAEDTGTFILQGEVAQPDIHCPAFYRLCDDNILMTSYKGNLLVANPKNNGILTYNIIFSPPEEWTRTNSINFGDAHSIVSFLSERYAGVADLYVQLFRATSSFWGLPTRRLPLDIPWKQDRRLPVTLIGDAAHLMPPFAGHGVNTGLVDALVLSGNLTGGIFETVEAAIADYERKMFVYAGEAQRESGKNEAEMRKPDFSFQKLMH